MDDPIEFISLAGRELEPRVVGLIAAAQSHPVQRRRSARAPAVAYTYAVAPERDLWAGTVRGAVAGIVGVEWRGTALWVRDIAVASDLRRRGIGRGLLVFVRTTYGVADLVAHATPAAAEFFAACGFDLEEFGRFRSGAPRVRCTLPAERPLSA